MSWLTGSESDPSIGDAGSAILCVPAASSFAPLPPPGFSSFPRSVAALGLDPPLNPGRLLQERWLPPPIHAKLLIPSRTGVSDFAPGSGFLVGSMSSKEEKAQAAAERIKAQALSQTKGLSRAQAERAAAAAARNVNAYGQKEEGPSRWQERKEAKRQMYLMSTEKAVTLGVRKDLKASSASGSGVAVQCQRCLQAGHWTYECKNEPVYISRPSRSQQLKNPKLRMKPTAPYELDNPDTQKVERDEKSRMKSKAKRSKKGKRKHLSGSDSGSDNSEASVFETESESSVTGSDDSSAESSSSYSSSGSEEERKRRNKRMKKKQKRRHRSYSSSDSSASESASDSDSDDSYSRRKSRRRGKRH
ncbi:hypothetical protein Taro_010045 [Colocasia esculenta]|uniref:Zinc finger CCHC domain-containing protein 10 n=1 Tax=Colocasia esculenta TaxID=4460 RepID=A0A843U5U9_COLES|nr:hypothetical protein [Colocasia esculenta]